MPEAAFQTKLPYLRKSPQRKGTSQKTNIKAFKIRLVTNQIITYRNIKKSELINCKLLFKSKIADNSITLEKEDKNDLP